MDEATQYQLNHGAHMMELLKQKRYAALDVADQVIAIFAAKENFLDDLDLSMVVPFRDELAAYMENRYSRLRANVREGRLSSETEDSLRSAIANFKAQFVADHGIVFEEAQAEESVPGFAD